MSICCLANNPNIIIIISLLVSNVGRRPLPKISSSSLVWVHWSHLVLMNFLSWFLHPPLDAWFPPFHLVSHDNPTHFFRLIQMRMSSTKVCSLIHAAVFLYLSVTLRNPFSMGHLTGVSLLTSHSLRPQVSALHIVTEAHICCLPVSTMSVLSNERLLNKLARHNCLTSKQSNSCVYLHIPEQFAMHSAHALIRPILRYKENALVSSSQVALNFIIFKS